MSSTLEVGVAILSELVCMSSYQLHQCIWKYSRGEYRIEWGGAEYVDEMFFLEFVLFLFCILEKKIFLLYFIYMYQRYSTYPYFCSVSECRLASVQARLAEVSADVPPPLQIVISVPICLFSLYLYPLSTPFLIFLVPPPFLLSLLINSLSS